MDGVAITDMAATGSTPTYYDFDMFQDMQVTTGGADVTSPTPGVQLNMVLKSGSNTPHGSTRIYFENESMQANNLSTSSPRRSAATAARATAWTSTTTRVRARRPIVKNRLWAWGAIGKTHVDLITLGGTHDRTELKDSSFKATASSTRHPRQLHVLPRRQAEVRPRRRPDARRRSHLQPERPDHAAEGRRQLRRRQTTCSLRRARRTSTAASSSRRAAARQPNVRRRRRRDARIDDTYKTERPQDNVSVDGNTFSGKHELKFGFGWRKATVDSSDTLSGNGVVTSTTAIPTCRQDHPAGHVLTDTVYTSAYGGDTWTMDR
jgi:hypothetical protein